MGMKNETMRKNISKQEEINKFKDEIIIPNMTSSLKVKGIGFQDGLGEGYFKEVPHFAIGLVSVAKNYIAYLMFEDEIPSSDECIPILNQAEEEFKSYRIPFSRKGKRKVHKILYVNRPKTMKDTEVDLNNIY